ncbi:MAG TPA: metallophosphoesterase [Longimicrobium sp.]|nr:metallophosphoesterase [Longimicrobium sp.]
MPKISRRRFLASVGAVGAAAATYGTLIEPRRLEVTRHVIGTRTADAREPLVLAQVTDLHIHGIRHVHHAIAARLAEIRPHAILFTGDSVDDAADLPVFAGFLRLLDPRTPKYAILGNWEHWGGVDRGELGNLYARHGGRLLVNETVVHAHAGRRLGITGLDDMVGGTPELRGALTGAEPADARLLLAHSPGYRDRLAGDAAPGFVADARVSGGVEAQPAEFRAMLSGHTHGGQVALFGWAPLLPPGSAGYVRGWFRGGGKVPLYVSRGIGESVLPVRLGSLPELAIHTVWV